MTRLLLINPNTSAATTAVMVGIARGAAPAGVMITGATVAAGVVGSYSRGSTAFQDGRSSSVTAPA